MPVDQLQSASILLAASYPAHPGGCIRQSLVETLIIDYDN